MNFKSYVELKEYLKEEVKKEMGAGIGTSARGVTYKKEGDSL